MLLAEAGLEGTSEAIAVSKGTAAAALRRLARAGFEGVAVTTPLKEEVAALCASLEPAAVEAGAVSALYLGSDGIRGANFDGIAATVALAAALPVPVQGHAIAVLGVGATGRAAIAALRSAGARVLIWNRTEERMLAVARAFGVDVWDGMPLAAAFVALPPNASLPVPILRQLAACPIVMDANYGSRATLEVQLRGPVEDGRAMLAAGARAAFVWWLAER